MGKINVLDKATAIHIAAGEVVTGPSSVVKELIENALDAGAKRLNVEIKDGGKNFIKITDDGEGIAPEDVPVAFMRHATSKIKHVSDLDNLYTLGFRGEALPSIAAVSKLTLVTRRYVDVAGTKIVLEGGRQVAISEAGCPPGTTIEVKDLFFNTPARRKFLRSNMSEAAKVADIVTRLALGNADVSFTLIHNDRKALQTSGKGLLAAITEVYGEATGRVMAPVAGEEGELKVSGYIADPTVLTRASQKHITFFLNHRHIKSTVLAQALQESLRSKIMTGRFPLAVLNIVMPPQMADINIHPAKMTARLYHEPEVVGLLKSSVQEVTGGLFPGRLEYRPGKNEIPQIQQIEADYRDASVANTHGFAFIKEPQEVFNTDIQYKKDIHVQAKFPAITPLVQVEGTYIVAHEAGQLFLIDQHAAHERILYEKLSERVKENYKQPFLVPVTIDLDAGENAILVENILLFQELGFDLEHFGGNTFLLRGMPLEVKDNPEKVFREIVADLCQEGRHSTSVNISEHLTIITACRMAIKAGDALQKLQMETLIKELSNCQNPYNCPHGRPTIIRVRANELEKKFKRVL